jgi:hypothetical protein
MTPKHLSKISATSRAVRRWGPRLVATYVTVDPRSLGLGRIGLGLLLLHDLARRVPGLVDWYSNEGLLPNHTVLWRPSADYVFSPLLAASRPAEVAIFFALFAIVYLFFTVGWHTRFFHFMSLVCLVSLHDRAIFLENGGDVALNLLCVWTLFLPMNARFSIDAVRRSLARREESARDLNERAPSRENPVVSLAVLAILLEISVIYYFNAVNKHGWTWRQGLAVHYVLYQERMVTWFGVLMRSVMTPSLSRILSYAALVIEIAAPFLILSPVRRVSLRRLAIVVYPALHLAFATCLNLGQFSFNMIGFFPLLLSAEDWDALGRRFGPSAARARVIYVDETSALGSAWARLLSRLDVFGRLRFEPLHLPGADAPSVMWMIEDPDTKRRASGAAGWADCLAALPCGQPFSWLMRLSPIQEVCRLAGRLIAVDRDAIAGALHATPFSRRVRSAEPRFSATRFWLSRQSAVVRELAALILLVTLTSQLLVENRAIPQRLKVPQPNWMTQLVVYPRLMQGWQMFAADVPTSERMLYVDAVTFDGRHVDPYNEAASRVAKLPVDIIPPHLEQDEFWCDYTNRLPDNEAYWRAFKEWIFNYHHRTGRGTDRIVSFEARLLEVDEPAPGEAGPKNVRTKIIMSERP